MIGVNEGSTDAHEIDTGPNIVRDSAVLKTPECGGLNYSIASEADERGAAPTHGASVQGFEPSSTAQVMSGGTVGAPADSFHFKDEISSFKGSGLVDVAELNQISASIGHHADGAATHVAPAISDGAQAIKLASPGQHPDDHFTVVPDHAPSTLVAQVPHDLIV